jgi:hypothetical protein
MNRGRHAPTPSAASKHWLRLRWLVLVAIVSLAGGVLIGRGLAGPASPNRRLRSSSPKDRLIPAESAFRREISLDANTRRAAYEQWGVVDVAACDLVLLSLGDAEAAT